MVISVWSPIHAIALPGMSIGWVEQDCERNKSWSLGVERSIWCDDTIGFMTLLVFNVTLGGWRLRVLGSGKHLLSFQALPVWGRGVKNACHLFYGIFFTFRGSTSSINISQIFLQNIPHVIRHIFYLSQYMTPTYLILMHSWWMNLCVLILPFQVLHEYVTLIHHSWCDRLVLSK